MRAPMMAGLVGAVVVLGGCGGVPESTAEIFFPQYSPSTVAYTSGISPHSATRDSGCPVIRLPRGPDVCGNRPYIMQAVEAMQVPALVFEGPEQVIGNEAHALLLDGAG